MSNYDLKPDGTPDYEAMETAIRPDVKMVYIQRSRGYSLRPSLFVEDIERIARNCQAQCAELSSLWWTTATASLCSGDEPTAHGALT